MVLTMQRTLILGAGFGGLAVAHELASQLGREHEIVLLDKSPTFMMGLRKPWAAAGIETMAAGCRDRAKHSIPGVQYLQRTILKIDPAARRVETDAGSWEADHLVVALGAEPRPDLVPGLAAHAHDLYDRDRIPALTDAFAQFAAGKILILVAGAPYKCPPAPYETAMLMEEQLRERGIRDRADLTVVTVQPLLMPNAGKTGSVWIGEQLAARGITARTGAKVRQVDAGRVLCEDGEYSYDLLIGVPPHRAPEVVRQSGLLGEGLWIQVDAATLRTRYEQVFAIGDVTTIPLANGLALPKAGLIAEQQGRMVGAQIAAQVRGVAAPTAFDGTGACFLETGRHMAGLIQGDFFAKPEPVVRVVGVSADNAVAKRQFEAERLTRWFGG
jgi:sulfide:quinone oxidoreductase